MKSFEDFLNEGQVKWVSADIGLANSLVKGLKERADYVMSLKIEEKSASVIFENIYDSLREAIDAILTLNGYKSYSHEASILYLKKFKQFTDTDINTLDRYRKKRNSSKYYGKRIEVYETEEIIEFYNRKIGLFLKLIEELMNKNK